MWMWGGACQGVDRQDMYYLRLNSNPTTDTWQQVRPVHLPMYYASTMAYDPDTDVLFTFGYTGRNLTQSSWVYCSTMGNTNPGVLTPAQSAAGCARPTTGRRSNQ